MRSDCWLGCNNERQRLLARGGGGGCGGERSAGQTLAKASAAGEEVTMNHGVDSEEQQGHMFTKGVKPGTFPDSKWRI